MGVAESRKTPGISASTAQILRGGLLEEGGSESGHATVSQLRQRFPGLMLLEFPGPKLPSREITTIENSPCNALPQQSEGFIGLEAETLTAAKITEDFLDMIFLSCLKFDSLLELSMRTNSNCNLLVLKIHSLSIANPLLVQRV